MLRCKLASEAERRLAFASVHPDWPHDPDPAVHLERRLASLHHQRAAWFVGLDEADQLGASLGVFPITLFGPGGLRPAGAIGAVYTPAAQRGRGYATALLREVMAWSAEHGVLDWILYSDIDPAFYERLGFVRVPSYEHHTPASDAAAGRWALGELPPRPCPVDPCGFEWGVDRDPDYRRWLIRKHNMPLRSWFAQRDDGLGGEVLTAITPEALLILESDLPHRAATWADVSALYALLAHRAGLPKAEGWWSGAGAPPPGVTPRKDATLMWASARPGDPWRAMVARSGPRLHLSEHV
ncbi:GNAT family N-acetyltransferase [Myxococcota bacterium]|nr:GNAT family N-acetyltransferase [Myxococcota bacterium]